MYIGIPYDQCNCWQLVRMVYDLELGIILPSYGEIDATRIITVARGIARNDDYPWIKVDEPQEFDVVLMRGSVHSQLVSHVGLWYKQAILHTLKGHNSVLVRPEHHSVSWRIQGYRRHAECNTDRLS